MLGALARLGRDPRVADPFASANGAAFFEWCAAHPDRQAAFDSAMAAGARMHGLALAGALDWTATRHVCDVGGGTGELLRVLVGAYPQLRGVVVEIPSVASRIEPVDGIEVRSADAFEYAEPGCDRYLFVNVVHDWSDDDAVRLLGTVRRVASDTSEVVLVESERRPRPMPGIALSTDLLMMALTPGGRERTTAEIAALGNARRLVTRPHRRVAAVGRQRLRPHARSTASSRSVRAAASRYRRDDALTAAVALEVGGGRLPLRNLGAQERGELIVGELAARDLARAEPDDSPRDRSGLRGRRGGKVRGFGVVDDTERGAERGNHDRVTVLHRAAEPRFAGPIAAGRFRARAESARPVRLTGFRLGGDVDGRRHGLERAADDPFGRAGRFDGRRARELGHGLDEGEPLEPFGLDALAQHRAHLREVLNRLGEVVSRVHGRRTEVLHRHVRDGLRLHLFLEPVCQPGIDPGQGVREGRPSLGVGFERRLNRFQFCFATPSTEHLRLPSW